MTTDAAVPSLARMYDWLLGGSASHESDRAAVAALEQARSGAEISARANRAFLRSTVQRCLDAGIEQFVELGSGLPNMGHVHEAAPGARVVYVDVEPAALAAGLPMLADNPDVAMIEADLRDVDRVLTDPALTRLIDLSQPVALFLISVLHWLPRDQDPADVVAAYRDRLAPGSLIAVSHLAGLEGEPAPGADPGQEGTPSGWRLHVRSPAEVEAMFRGLHLMDPGLFDLLQSPFNAAAERPRLTSAHHQVIAGLGSVPADAGL